jgi:hypothetical protein
LNEWKSKLLCSFRATFLASAAEQATFPNATGSVQRGNERSIADAVSFCVTVLLSLI